MCLNIYFTKQFLWSSACISFFALLEIPRARVVSCLKQRRRIVNKRRGPGDEQLSQILFSFLCEIRPHPIRSIAASSAFAFSKGNPNKKRVDFHIFMLASGGCCCFRLNFPFCCFFNSVFRNRCACVLMKISLLFRRCFFFVSSRSPRRCLLCFNVNNEFLMNILCGYFMKESWIEKWRKIKQKSRKVNF